MTRVIEQVSGVTDLSLNSEPSVFPVDPPRITVRTCRACGCTNENCSVCVGLVGRACAWVTDYLCSACVEQAETLLRLYARNGNRTTALGMIYHQAVANWAGNGPATVVIERAASVLREARPNAAW